MEHPGSLRHHRFASLHAREDSCLAQCCPRKSVESQPGRRLGPRLVKSKAKDGAGVGSQARAQALLLSCSVYVEYNRRTTVHGTRTRLLSMTALNVFTHVRAPLTTTQICIVNRPSAQQASPCASGSADPALLL